MSNFSDIYDDISTVSNNRSRDSGVIVLSVVRNEMYFLPAFLKHYRALGVESFVFLDDQSVDGTREFLSNQPGVAVVESKHGYGEKVVMPFRRRGKPVTGRMLHAWRNILGRKFGVGRWTMQVDADEFLRLPPGRTLPNIAKRLDERGERMAWGVLLDAYPESITDLKSTDYSGPFDPDLSWYFDAIRHFKLRGNRSPKRVYAGSRARLLSTFHLHPKETALHRVLKTLSGARIIRGFNVMYKPTLVKWVASDDWLYRNSHAVRISAAKDILFPILHYKFTGSMYARIAAALKEKAHHSGSKEYVSLERLIAEMERRQARFTCGYSRPVGDFANFVKSGNYLFPERNDADR